MGADWGKQKHTKPKHNQLNPLDDLVTKHHIFMEHSKKRVRYLGTEFG